MFPSLWIGVFDQNVKAVKLYKAHTKGGLANNKYSIEYFLNKKKKLDYWICMLLLLHFNEKSKGGILVIIDGNLWNKWYSYTFILFLFAAAPLIALDCMSE